MTTIANIDLDCSLQFSEKSKSILAIVVVIRNYQYGNESNCEPSGILHNYI